MIGGENMKKLLVVLLALTMIFAFAACQGQEADVDTEVSPEENTEPLANVLALKGPTGVAVANMSAIDTFELSFADTPDAVVAALSTGEADIAALPTNLAAKLYAKNDKDMQMLAIIASGSLYVLENGDTIQSMEDLAGKTIYATGQGANPQYILEALLRAADLEPGVDVEIIYKSEHAELASLMAAGEVDIAMLPEPNVAAVMLKNEAVRVALDLNEQWNDAMGGDLTMSCVVATRTFAENNPDIIDEFLAQIRDSIISANSDAAGTAQICVDLGLFDNNAMVENSIPRMGLYFTAGEGLQEAAEGYLNMLFAADPTSVGGAMPEADFYYEIVEE